MSKNSLLDGFSSACGWLALLAAFGAFAYFGPWTGGTTAARPGEDRPPAQIARRRPRLARAVNRLRPRRHPAGFGHASRGRVAQGPGRRTLPPPPPGAGAPGTVRRLLPGRGGPRRRGGHPARRAVGPGVGRRARPARGRWGSDEVGRLLAGRRHARGGPGGGREPTVRRHALGLARPPADRRPRRREGEHHRPGLLPRRDDAGDGEHGGRRRPVGRGDGAWTDEPAGRFGRGTRPG